MQLFPSNFFVCSLGLFLLMLPAILGLNSELCPHQVFKDHGCICTTRHIRCSGLREFPILTKEDNMITTINIRNNHFLTLNRSHLKFWNKLEELYITDSALSEVTNDALGHLNKIHILQITGCQLTQFPNISGLRLSRVLFQYNNIREVSYEQVKQCSVLSTVDLKGNKITVLKNGTFRDSCYLSKLNVSENPLHTIESHFFEGLSMEILDLSYTNIDQFPVFGLRYYLKILNLDGCKKLKKFPRLETTYENHLCTNLTFPFLQKINFEYHALCCQFQSVRYLESAAQNISRCTRNSNAKSVLFKRAVLPKQPVTSTHTTKYQKRSISSNYVCLNLSSGHIVRDYYPKEEEIFNISILCQNISFCFDNRCPHNCDNTDSSYQSSLSVNVACVEEINPAPITLSTTICWTNGTITSLPSSSNYFVSSSIYSPSHTPSMTPTPIDYSECPNDECWDCILDDCDPEECKQFQGYCDAEGAKKRKRREAETNLDITCTSITTTLIPMSTPCSNSSNETEPILSSSYDVSSSTASPTPSVTPTPTSVIDYSECPNDECWDCILDDCDPEECKQYQGYCDAEGAKKRKRRETNESISVDTPEPTLSCYEAPIVSASLTCYENIVMITSTSTTQMSMPTPSPSSTQVVPMPTECPNDECFDCILDDCDPPECQQYRYYCDNARKRRDLSDNSIKCSVVLHVAGYSILSASLNLSPSSTTAIVAISTTTAVQNSLIGTSLYVNPTPFCEPVQVLSGQYYSPGPLIECGPNNDPFNPCDDVIDSDVLRAGMWLVILLSIGGNVLVISVTATYFILRYFRNRKKPHVMYFLYINLALADLFMGIYLLTIAIVDLETMGEYGLHAIEWQTSAGCRFAGFCAILSSMLSVYTLLIITLERVYTIKFALRHKRYHTHYAVISIIIGWIFTIILCILPMFNVSSYSRVSICLPFETRDVVDKLYVASLLVLTGIASFIILVCYCILFYMVTCKRKRIIHNNMSGREELKLALRMSLLVLTDFACWAPIAFFGLTAAFQAPLIGVKEAKILMVFIFPINSCLNPILYSFSTRKFQTFICALFKCCGPCKKQNFRGFHSSTGPYIPDRKISQDNSTEHGRTRRRGTQISILSRFKSISSFHGSTSSNQGSRRGSTFSGSSDDGCALQLHTRHFRPPSPTSGHGLRRENISLTSVNSDSSFSSSNTNTGSIGHLIPPTNRDRRVSLASLSGILTALPEEKEEDTISVKLTNNKKDNVAIEMCHYKEVTADIIPQNSKTYFNAFADNEEDNIEFGFNETDGTEYQQQQINFYD